MQFNPTNYPLVTPVPADTLLLRQASTGRIRSALVSAVANAASPVAVVNSIAELKAIATDGLADNSVAEVTGYYGIGDGGGGLFYYSLAGSGTDNQGTIIEPDDGTGRWFRIYSGALNVRWFGATGDGATDDRTAIQLAVNLLSADGGALYFPAGRYLCESSVSLPITGKQVTFFGDGQFASVIVSGLPAGAATALLRGNGTITDRCYFCARDMALEGDGSAGVHGIYLQYGTPFSEFSNLLVNGFIDGIRLANIYRMDLINVQSILNVNGLVAGLDISDVAAVCNAINIVGGRYGSNTGKGIHFYGCRNVCINGGDVENCGTHGLHAEYVFGLTVNSLYSESSLVGHSTVAHYCIENCRGATLTGCNVSNWFAGNVLFKIDGSSGVVLNGLNTELGIGSVVVRAGTAVEITDSQGVVINACEFDNIVNAITVTDDGRVMINYCYFDNVTTPLTMPNQATSNALWNGAYGADLSASSIGAASRYVAQLQEGTTSRQNWTD